LELHLLVFDDFDVFFDFLQMRAQDVVHDAEDHVALSLILRCGLGVLDRQNNLNQEFFQLHLNIRSEFGPIDQSFDLVVQGTDLLLLQNMVNLLFEICVFNRVIGYDRDLRVDLGKIHLDDAEV
jgi:hypothetical protein